MRYKIVNTDNFGSDYPDESFVNLPATSLSKAQSIALAINNNLCPGGMEDRYYKVVPEDYILQPGFEP